MPEKLTQKGLNMTLKIKSTITAFMLSVSTFALPAFAENPLLDSDFWKEADLAKVEAAVAAGADPTEKGEGLYIPIVRAIRGKASIEIIDYLVSKGADVNRPSHDGRPGIFWAGRYGDLAMVKHIIKLGADPTVTEGSGRNALGYAAFGQPEKDVFEYLLSLGLDPNNTDDAGRNAVLSAAYVNSNLAAVEYLASISDITARTNDGADAFMLAAGRNMNLDVVKMFMATSKDIHAVTTKDGSDALLLAAYRNGNLEVFKFLLDNGFSTDAKTTEGRSALSLAVHRNSQDVIQMFLDAGNDVNKADTNGKTPLFYAAVRNSPMVFEQLIGAGAEVNVTAKDGTTPLLIAAKRSRSGSEEIIATLIAAGADVTVADTDGTTVLIASTRIGHSLDTLKSFVAGGANVNTVDGDKMSALMYAALKSEDPAIITYLLSVGADPKLGDDFDDTAADFIAENPALKGSEIADTLAALAK